MTNRNPPAPGEEQCLGCDQLYDENGYCPRCEGYASEQPPPKTLEQLMDEYPELRAERDELRARLMGELEQFTSCRPDPFPNQMRSRAA